MSVANLSAPRASIPRPNADVLTNFRIIACQQPAAIAIEDDARTWRYDEAAQAVRCIRDGLLQAVSTTPDKLGNKPTFVGLCLDHSAEAILSMLAVMDAGMAFVPLDPQYPAERLNEMIQDAPIALILSSTKSRHSLQSIAMNAGAATPTLLDIDELCARPVGEAEPTPTPIDPATLAYVMYTSGSTGRPKGVAISHQALSQYCASDVAVYQLRSDDRTLQFSTLNFDIAIEEIFPPLISGSTVVVRPSRRSNTTNELSTITNEKNITAIHLATAYWHHWVDLMKASGQRVPSCLRLMVVTGEKVSVPHYRDWLNLCDHDVLWANAYGPTEATVSSTVFMPPAGWLQTVSPGTNMPIGDPLPGYQAFILDSNDQPCRPGQTGQLFIGGAALADGYLHRPDLTRKAFRSIRLDGQPRRVYATGDLARWSNDNQIDFAGRIDDQIKLGSYRIEPGEIEAACNALPMVNDSVVGIRQSQGQKRLHVHLAIGEEALQQLTDDSRRAAFAADVVAGLGDRLPAHMIPQQFSLLACFPTTLNGKIDRDALPDRSNAITPRRSQIVIAEDADQARMVEIWKEVLGVDDLSIDDDFFQLGGSSLLVTQVIAKWCQGENRSIPVRDFFANPTIRSVTACLRGTAPSTQLQPQVHPPRPRIQSDFIATDEDHLHAVWTHPTSRPRRHLVVLEAAWGHEWTRGYRNLQQLALLLARHGYTVARCDHVGIGQSSGRETDQTPTTYCQAWRALLRQSRERFDLDTLSIVGLRMGGNVIRDQWAEFVRSARSLSLGINRCILWDPLCDGRGWLGMVDGFHRELCCNLTRFAVHREPSDVDEALGMLLTPSRRRWIESIKIEKSLRDRNVDFVWSRGCEPSGLIQSNHHLVDDVIAWDRLDCVDAAFASPKSYRKILDLLGDSV